MMGAERGVALGVVGACLRADRRRRWRDWLRTALLVGVLGGALIALVAGAERTRSSYGRFLDTERAIDLAGGSGGCYDPTAECDLTALANLPSVEEVALFRVTGLVGSTDDGRQLDSEDQLFVAHTDTAYGRELNGWEIVDGRLPDPERPDEVIVGRDLARVLELEVGSELELMFEISRGEDVPPEPAPRQFRVVGIEISPGEVQPPGGRYLRMIHGTPAFTESADRDGITIRQESAAVRLSRGATVDDFVADVARERIDFNVTFRQDEHAEGIDRGNRAEANALLLVAALTGAAGLLILAQSLGRSVTLASDDHPVLAAIGVRTGERFWLGLARVTPIAVGGGASAAVVAFGLSPVFPVGDAREFDPSLGLHADNAVVVLGPFTLAMVVMLLATVPAWRTARARPVGTTLAPALRRRRPRRIPPGLSPVAFALGVRGALDPGRGRTAVPVRSTLGALTIAVVALTGALTFRSSAHHLLSEERLYGITWDLAVANPPEIVPTITAALERRDDVDALAVGSLGQPFADHALLVGDQSAASEEVDASGTGEVQVLVTDDVVGEMAPAIIEGHAPLRSNEIALGSETLTSAGLSVGDRVEVGGQDGETYEETRATVEVVGRGVFPNLSEFGRLGEGAAMTAGAMEQLNPAWSPGVVFIGLADGADPDDVLAGIEEATGDRPDVVEEPPGLVEDTARIADMPAVMAATMAAAGIALLLHSLVTSVDRRRVDFAVLRTLGLRARQVRRAVGWQAVATSAVALALGSPLGVALGRGAWTLYADQLGVVNERLVPPTSLLFLVGAGLALATVLGLAVGRRPGRRAPALELADE